jgi:hypothetical protein
MPRNIRQIRIEGQLAYVPLTHGYEAIIDAVDVPLVNGRNWQASPQPHSVYAQGMGQLMHRVIAGTPEGMETDHIDGNGLNNRRANLRSVTASQNQHNKRMQKNNTSGFKGVHWHIRKRRWVARINLDNTKRHLGYFDTAEAAHAAYCVASKALHGEFGRTS